MIHLKFPSLEQFDAVYARETWEGLPARRSLTYRAKIKLHGTNCGIMIDTMDRVQAIGRNTMLAPDTDRSGFAAWLEPQKHLWAGAGFHDLITFYGEWAGPGIAKGDAIQKTDKKRFFIFALGFGSMPHPQKPEIMIPRLMITDPEAIDAWLPAGLDRDRVRVLPYEDEEPTVFDFADDAQIEAQLERINRSVEAVAERDPYVSRTFGIDHPGEGFVLVPHATADAPVPVEVFARTAFKTKTEKHRVRQQAKAATPREPLPETASQLIETFVTPQRVQQAIDEICNADPDRSATGKVIAWVTADVAKEAAREIEALGVDFSRLKSAIADTARGHFLAALDPA